MKYKKSILIVGGTGIIGSYLNTIFSQSYEITVISQNGGILDSNFVKLDLTNKLQTKVFVEKSPQYDILIFLVGLAHSKGTKKHYDQYYKINFLTLKNLFSELINNKKLPKKIIYSSTISIYGESLKQDLFLEESMKNPKSPYAVTKLLSEKYLLKHFIDKLWILRFGPVYSSQFLLNIKRRTKISKFFYRIGDGNVKLSLCNIRNIEIAIEQIIKNLLPAGIYNVCDSIDYSYNDLLKIQNPKWVLPIPSILIKILYSFGKTFGIIFLKENSIKLLKNNIYSSKKIRKYVNLPYTLEI